MHVTSAPRTTPRAPRGMAGATAGGATFLSATSAPRVTSDCIPQWRHTTRSAAVGALSGSGAPHPGHVSAAVATGTAVSIPGAGASMRSWSGPTIRPAYTCGGAVPSPKSSVAN
jgi:hypothetical protein